MTLLPPVCDVQQHFLVSVLPEPFEISEGPIIIEQDLIDVF